MVNFNRWGETERRHNFGEVVKVQGCIGASWGQYSENGLLETPYTKTTIFEYDVTVIVYRKDYLRIQHTEINGSS